MASIQQKDEVGLKWLMIVSDGYNGNKKVRRTKMFYGPEDKAQKAADKFEDEVKNGRYCAASKDYKFADFVTLWMQDYAEPELAPKTVARYKEMLETRILPAIGNMRLDKIKPMTINRLKNDIAEMPRLDKKPGKLSAQTVKHHFRCISAILQDAEEWDVIKENPCSRVKSPKVKRAKIKVFDENETSAFLTALESAPLKHRTLIWLEIATGLREGEIMGLDWDNINFDSGTITIEKASQYLPERGTFTKDPKNEESIRTIALPKNVIGLLKQYRAEWAARRLKLGSLWRGSGLLAVFAEIFNDVTPKEVSAVKVIAELRKKEGVAETWESNIKIFEDKLSKDKDFINELHQLGCNVAIELAALATLNDKQLKEFVSFWREKKKNPKEGRLFVTWDGRPGSPTWPVKWLDKFLKKNNLPHCSFHSLRHLSATMAIKAKVPLKNVSSRLGHTDIGTTANIYAEALKSVDREAAEVLGALLENKQSEQEKNEDRK